MPPAALTADPLAAAPVAARAVAPAGARIAVVQHGDYAEAHRLIAAGEPEPYFGMAYTLRVLRDLFAGGEHLVVSLDAPPYAEQHGAGRWVGLPCPTPTGPGRLMPATARALLWAGRIRRELEAFAPTHVLLRTGGLLAWRLLRYCTARRLDTLVVLAGVMGGGGIKERFVTRRLVRQLNHPAVFLVGNHKRPATESMTRCGVDPAKAAAWDWPGLRKPADHPVKSLPPAGPYHVAFVGSMTRAKGVGDLIEAVALLRARGRDVRLTAAGDGPDLAHFRQRAAGPGLAGAVALPGRVGNEEAFALFRSATLACVPSRHEFTEGMPLALLEALASRTPAVISDHPIFAPVFADGQGVRFFKAADAQSLADALAGVLDDPAGYARLSESTAGAFGRVECETMFGDLVERWKIRMTKFE